MKMGNKKTLPSTNNAHVVQRNSHDWYKPVTMLMRTLGSEHSTVPVAEVKSSSLDNGPH